MTKDADNIRLGYCSDKKPGIAGRYGLGGTGEDDSVQIKYDPDGNRMCRQYVEYQSPSNPQTTTRKYIVDIVGGKAGDTYGAKWQHR